nr:unnamed protein product [Spirometra erinaceieuropaei]
MTAPSFSPVHFDEGKGPVNDVQTAEHRGMLNKDHCIIIQGLPESSASTPRERFAADLEHFQKFLNELLQPTEDVTVLKAFRLRNPTITAPQTRPRPLKLVLDRKSFEKDLLDRARVNPKVLYSYIRQSTRNKDPIPLLRTAVGVEISDDKDKAEHLFQFFRSVVTKEPAFSSPAYEDEETPTLEAVFFTEAIVRNKLLNLKESTSPGPDAIPAKLLKELAPETSKP